MLKKMLFLLISAALGLILGCATSGSSKLTDDKVYTISTTPPGAKIVVSKFGKEGMEYTSPASIVLRQGIGLIEVSKDGYWDEDRMVMQTFDMKFERNWSDMATGAIVGGLAGAIIMAPIMPDAKVTPKTIIMERPQFQSGRNYANPSISKSSIVNNTIDIKLTEIPAPLKPLMASLNITSLNSYKELNMHIDKLNSEGKISINDVHRAKQKFNDVYFGKFQRKNQPNK
jgi:hypothetical protein